MTTQTAPDGQRLQQVLPSTEQLEALQQLAIQFRGDDPPRMTWYEAWTLANAVSWYKVEQPDDA